MEPGVRYIVEDVPEAVAFYERLGFENAGPRAPGFALLRGHGLTLLLNVPGAGGAGHAADDGSTPAPGGWNRFQIVVRDVRAHLEQLERDGVPVRMSVVDGQAGAQAVIEDPSGNPVELFTPAG